MDAAAEIGRNSVSKHRIQPEYGDEQADAGRDCRTRLARPNVSGANGDKEILIFPVQLTTSRIGNLTRLLHTLAICDDHTYLKREHSLGTTLRITGPCAGGLSAVNTIGTQAIT